MKIKKIIRNNLFMFGLIRKASPGRLRFCLLVVLLDSISSFLFDVYMIRYVINSIQTAGNSAISSFFYCRSRLITFVPAL
jgi:hypothetical protein